MGVFRSSLIQTLIPFDGVGRSSSDSSDGDEEEETKKGKIRYFPEKSKMSAFNAFKACVPVEWSPQLYITLVRGLPGTRRLHSRTLDAMRLRRCNRTVLHRNTPSLLGMLNQVKRLVVVETDAMFKARKEKQEAHRALRPPKVVTHHPQTSVEPAQ